MRKEALVNELAATAQVNPGVQELFRRILGPAIADEPQPTTGVVDCKPAASKNTTVRSPEKTGISDRQTMSVLISFLARMSSPGAGIR